MKKKMKAVQDVAFAAVKTIVVVPWAAACALAGIAGFPVAAWFSLVVSDSFSEFFDTAMGFYADHLYGFSGIESLVDTWKDALRRRREDP